MSVLSELKALALRLAERLRVPPVRELCFRRDDYQSPIAGT